MSMTNLSEEISAAFAQELKADVEFMRTHLPDSQIASALLAAAIHVAKESLPDDCVATWLQRAVDGLTRDGAFGVRTSN